MNFQAFSILDTCAGTHSLPVFFVNTASAIRSMADVVNRPKEDNIYYQHPEHHQLYSIGTFDDSNGTFVPEPPRFIVAFQELVSTPG